MEIYPILNKPGKGKYVFIFILNERAVLECQLWTEVHFCHLTIKFLAEIICNTKNFSNFTFGNHDTVFIVCSSKLLNISDITKRIDSFFKLPIQLFMVFLIPNSRYLIIAWMVMGISRCLNNRNIQNN